MFGSRRRRCLQQKLPVHGGEHSGRPVYRDRRFSMRTPWGGFDFLAERHNTFRDYRQREFARAPWFILELSGTF